MGLNLDLASTSIYICDFISHECMYSNVSQIPSPSLALSFISYNRWLDPRSGNGYRTFVSTDNIFFLTGCSVCKWCLCGGDVIEILLIHFFGSTKLIQIYYSFYVGLIHLYRRKFQKRLTKYFHNMRPIVKNFCLKIPHVCVLTGLREETFYTSSKILFMSCFWVE